MKHIKTIGCAHPIPSKGSIEMQLLLDHVVSILRFVDQLAGTLLNYHTKESANNR